MRIWTDAVRNAILRHIAQTGDRLFTRQALIAAEGAAMKAETGTVGLTPTQTATRELQLLRDAGEIDFVSRGNYRWLGPMPAPALIVPSKAVFVLDAASPADALPEHRLAFEPRWLLVARRTVGEWIIVQETAGYRAAARVEQLDPTPSPSGWCAAKVSSDTYLEFGRVVPLEIDGRAVEVGVARVDGSLDAELGCRRVRAISLDDFNRILDLGLITEEDSLPRQDAPGEERLKPLAFEERAAWEGPVDRTTVLVNRKVRDQQFRKRVLDAYGARCALTGMKLINGGGRSETEAAHIMSVKAGGPDAVTNGIALSGTVHWMFDRGLISLSDAGDILLSRAINDCESVERLIHADRRARLPALAAHRPHPRYLQWHRTECFHH